MVTARQYDENVLTNECPMCGEKGFLIIEPEKIKEVLVNIRNIQDILPDHSPEEREFIITGMCPKCQGKVFLDDDGNPQEFHYIEGRWLNEEMMGGME